MTDIPVSVPVLTTLVDDQDDVLASHQNTPNNEIEAMATMIGMLGITQSKSLDFLDGLVNMILPSAKISFVDTETVRISIGRIWCQKSDGGERVLRKNTGTTDLTGADLDTGGPSLANSTVYYVHAVADAVATTFTGIISLSATAPSGDTIVAVIGGFTTDGSGNVIASTLWSRAGMRIINVKYHYRQDTTSGTTVTPTDSTKPTISEGDEYLTLPYTPKESTNLLFLLGIVCLSTSGSSNVIAHMHKDSDDSLVTAVRNQAGSGLFDQLILPWLGAAGAGKRTYSVRAGMASAGTLYLNRNAAANDWGDTLASVLLAIEFEV